MKQPIRFFSIGLLTAALMMVIFYLFFDDSTSSIENASIDELIDKVESDGYRVITEKEFIAYSLLQDEAHEEEQTSKNKEKKDTPKKDKPTPSTKDKKEKPNKKDDKKSNEEEPKEEIKKVTFTTESGVVSQDIADILYENDIIDDRQKFIKYLDDNDYSPYIQLGKFEVNSEMSLKEIAETITTYPGN